VVVGAPAAYFATLPIKAAVRALREARLPAAVSNSAGTFLCNHVFYGLMHEAAARGAFRGGFLHVPFLPSQAAQVPGAPSMALEQIVEGIEIILSVAAGRSDDLAISEGTMS
jgi:pyroglutamyl-peptidase